jgi:hypothetical protein
VLGAPAAGAAAPNPTAVQPGHTIETGTRSTEEIETMTTHRFVGMWVTADGHIRHELLPNGRYDEQRGSRRSAYQGRYTITGNRIDYVDDTGFTADGEFIDGVLHHAGMLLHRER